MVGRSVSVPRSRGLGVPPPGERAVSWTDENRNPFTRRLPTPSNSLSTFFSQTGRANHQKMGKNRPTPTMRAGEVRFAVRKPGVKGVQPQEKSVPVKKSI